jgi:hypothetical protein
LHERGILNGRGGHLEFDAFCRNRFALCLTESQMGSPVREAGARAFRDEDILILLVVRSSIRRVTRTSAAEAKKQEGDRCASEGMLEKNTPCQLSRDSMARHFRWRGFENKLNPRVIRAQFPRPEKSKNKEMTPNGVSPATGAAPVRGKWAITRPIATISSLLQTHLPRKSDGSKIRASLAQQGR